MKRKALGAQNVSRMCVVCGRENHYGLRGRFFELEDGQLAGIFRTLEEHQGYPGRVHGGVCSTVLDETIGRAINISDAHAWGVTVELSVRFRKPVPIGEVRVLSRITKDSRRLFEGSGEIVLPDGSVAVEAHGKYMKLAIQDIAGELVDSGSWFEDEEPLPESIDI